MNILQGDDYPIPSSEDFQEAFNFNNNNFLMTEQDQDINEVKKINQQQQQQQIPSLKNIEIVQSQEKKGLPITGTLANPQQIKEAQKLGELKLQQPLWDVLILSIVCGILISFGCLVAQRISSQTTHILNYETGETRIRKEGFGYTLCVFSIFYPLGIMISIILNTHYFTACLFLFPPVIIHKKASIKDVLKFQFICLIGNIFGALIFTWIVGYWTMNTDDGIKEIIAQIAEERLKQGFGTQFIKGFGYAWVLSLTMLMYLSSRSLFSKQFALWVQLQINFSIFYSLVSWGQLVWDVISNIYFIVSGMMSGANVTFGDFIGYSFLPQLLGHYISPNFLVGFYYTYLYHWPEKNQ